jgi:hypothetical protein
VGYRPLWYDSGMKRTLIRHDGLYRERGNRFYSVLLERSRGGRVRLLTLRGVKRYSGDPSRRQEKVFYEGRDLRRAHELRERIVHARLTGGYRLDVGTLALPIRRHLLASGARHDEVFSELSGVALAPERVVGSVRPAHLVIPTLRGRTRRKQDRRRNYYVPNGRSWMVSEPSGLRLISARPGFEHWNALLTRVGTDLLAPFAPFVIEGSHGAVSPSTREYPYDDPEFLPEDLVRIAGDYVGDLPYAERRALLEELLKTLDRLGDVSMIVPPETRELLAAEANEAVSNGRLKPGSQVLPLLRRLDATIDDRDARLLLVPPVERPARVSA